MKKEADMRGQFYELLADSQRVFHDMEEYGLSF